MNCDPGRVLWPLHVERLPESSAEALEALERAQNDLARVRAFLAQAYDRVGGSALARLADTSQSNIKNAVDRGWDAIRPDTLRKFLTAITKNLSGGPIPSDPIATGWRAVAGRPATKVPADSRKKTPAKKKPVGRPRKKS